MKNYSSPIKYILLFAVIIIFVIVSATSVILLWRSFFPQKNGEVANALSNGNQLYEAACNGDIKTIKTLLANGADIQAEHNNALKVAVVCRQAETVKELIKAGANVNDTVTEKVTRNTAWAMARGNNYTEIVKILEEAGARVDSGQKRLALEIASAWGNLEVVKQLIAEGVNVNGDEDIPVPLVQASKNGRTKVVEELLRANANVNKKCDKCHATVKDMSALIAAASWGHDDIVQLLIDNGANVNLQGDEEYTALNYVAHGNGSSVITQKLLKAGAKPNIKTQYGDNALSLAIDSGNFHLLAPLLEAGANPNIESENGFIPLIQAAAKGNENAVKLLIEYGANVNKQTSTKQDNALILAADNNHLDIVKILLEAGADPNIKNITGKDAAGYARQRGYTQIENFLREAANNKQI